MSNTDPIELKQRLGYALARRDEVHHMAVMYVVYKTLEKNTQLTLNRLKALLTVEYMIPEESINGALAALISRSMFNCVTRYKSPDKSIDEMQVSVTKPPPEEFLVWLARVSESHPEFTVFDPPVFKYKRH